MIIYSINYFYLVTWFPTGCYTKIAGKAMLVNACMYDHYCSIVVTTRKDGSFLPRPDSFHTIFLNLKDFSFNSTMSRLIFCKKTTIFTYVIV